MKLSLKRIISTGNFIPEIDGLRFVAIVSVLVYHLSGFLQEKDVTVYKSTYDFEFLLKVFSNGHVGVPLFFVISGFVLGLPFAQSYFTNDASVNIWKYFKRRLTRLEPPYILVMTGLFFGSVYVAKNLSLVDAGVSYLSSLIYSHNFIYGHDIFPLLNSPAWSLEIEVQFYILAPVFAKIFSIKSHEVRRAIIIISIFLLIWVNNIFTYEFRTIFNYLQYFLAGFLLVDFYLNQTKLIPSSKFDLLFIFILLIPIFIFDKNDFTSLENRFIYDLEQLAAIVIFYIYVIINKSFKVLSFPLITNIGGMCYTIYLIHYPIISFIGNIILKFTFSENQLLNSLIYAIFILIVVSLFSIIFFLLFERPFMDKDWFKKISKKKYFF